MESREQNVVGDAHGTSHVLKVGEIVWMAGDLNSLRPGLFHALRELQFPGNRICFRCAKNRGTLHATRFQEVGRATAVFDGKSGSRNVGPGVACIACCARCARLEKWADKDAPRIQTFYVMALVCLIGAGLRGCARVDGDIRPSWLFATPSWIPAVLGVVALTSWFAGHIIPVVVARRIRKLGLLMGQHKEVSAIEKRISQLFAREDTQMREKIYAQLADSMMPKVQPISSSSITPEARLLFHRFFHGETGEEISTAAKAIGECLDRNDTTSQGILDLLKPQVRIPTTGPSGSELLDLTGGRPETPQWIALQLVINQHNPFYHEYTNWVLHNYNCYDPKWVGSLVEYLSSTASSEMVRVNCNRILEERRTSGCRVPTTKCRVP